MSEKVTGDSLVGPTVEAYHADWLNGVEVRNAKERRERYGNSVRLFLEQLGERAKNPINTLTPRDFDAFGFALAERGIPRQYVVTETQEDLAHAC